MANDQEPRAVDNTTVDGPSFPFPRVTIQFCTQCKWMLRAAYFAQELLSTFSTSLGEVALQPSTGGVFIVKINYNQPDPESKSLKIQSKVLWDRKTDGGFPETKELKRRVRDVIQPDRDLGHVDRDYGKPKATEAEVVKPAKGSAPVLETETEAVKKCEDCQ